MCTAFFEGSWSPPNWGIVKFLLGFVILWHSVTPGSSGCCTLTLSFSLSLSEDRTSPSWIHWVDKLSSLLRTTLMLSTVLPSHLAGGLSLWMPMIKQMRWVHAFLFFFFVCRQQPLVSKNSPFLLAVRLQLVIRTKLSDLTLFTLLGAVPYNPKEGGLFLLLSIWAQNVQLQQWPHDFPGNAALLTSMISLLPVH